MVDVSYESPKTPRLPTTESEKKYLYAKSAGRCNKCYKYIITPSTSEPLRSIAQLAHIIGATNDKKSPRRDPQVSPEKKAAHANFIVLCFDCHDLIDQQELEWPEERLEALKREFEERIEKATNFSSLRKSLVISVSSKMRGQENNSLSSADIKQALLNNNLEIMDFNPFQPLLTIQLSDENWEEGKSEIDKAVSAYRNISQKLDFDTTSIFGIAPIPYLFYLGYRIKNRNKVNSMTLSKSNWGWTNRNYEQFGGFQPIVWPNITELEELNLIISVNNKINEAHIPKGMSNLPSISISPMEHNGKMQKIEDEQSLLLFADYWSDTLKEIHSEYKHLKKINIFAAVPNSIAFIMGQNYMDNSYAKAAIFYKIGQDYIQAVEVN